MTFDPGASPFRLRIGVENIADTQTGEFELYLKKNSGSYAAITASSTGGVQSYDASSDADNTIIRVPRLYPFSPDWQLSGAAIDLDFAGNRIYGGTAFTDFLSCSRASVGCAQESATSAWISFAADQLRVTNRGLLTEDTRTNYLINSDTPATQTTGSLATGTYTLWVNGSGSALASAGTATITGASSATDGSPNSFTVSVAGTVIVTITGTLVRFQLENGSFASSYIPTGAVSAVRAADMISCTGMLNTILNSTSAISVYVDAIMTGAVDYSTILDSFVGTQVLMYARWAGNDQSAAINWTGGLNPEAFGPGSGGWLTGAKAVTAVDHAVGGSICINGGTVAVDNTKPTTFSGSSVPWTVGVQTGGSFHSFLYIRRLAVWTTRLADATLPSLTAQ